MYSKNYFNDNFVVKYIDIYMDTYVYTHSHTSPSTTPSYPPYPIDEKEEKVRKLFAVCGDIDNVRLIRDKNTCMGKGFGYVLFKVMRLILYSDVYML